METNAITAVLWNKRTFHCYATTRKKQDKLNVSSAIINAHKNTLFEMRSKYCSGEIISDKFIFSSEHAGPVQVGPCNAFKHSK